MLIVMPLERRISVNASEVNWLLGPYRGVFKKKKPNSSSITGGQCSLLDEMIDIYKLELIRKSCGGDICLCSNAPISTPAPLGICVPAKSIER